MADTAHHVGPPPATPHLPSTHVLTRDGSDITQFLVTLATLENFILKWQNRCLTSSKTWWMVGKINKTFCTVKLNFKAYLISNLVWYHLMPSNVKIILHRIISVVWLTNFLSEILNQSTHDDELSSRSWAWRGAGALQRSCTLMIAHLPFTGGWRGLLLSE